MGTEPTHAAPLALKPASAASAQVAMSWALPLRGGLRMFALAQGQINIFSYLVSVETNQLCCCVQNQRAWLCSDKSFFTKTGGELDLAHNLPNPA